jgi:hypothetical protein
VSYDDAISNVGSNEAAAPAARVIGGIGWSLCALKVERKVEKKGVEIKNKFQAFAEKEKEMSDMIDSDDESDDESEECGFCGTPEMEFIKAETEFIKVPEKKVRFEKMPKKQTQGMAKKSRSLEINVLQGEKRKSKITIDSGAEESVWPIDQVAEGDLVETEASRNDIGFVAANGARMKNYGALKVDFENDGKAMQMNFHATTVKKPLAAVCRITDCGNKVCFGPRPEDNYILNVATQERILMKRERGTYVLEIDVKDANKSSVFTRRE